MTQKRQISDFLVNKCKPSIIFCRFLRKKAKIILLLFSRDGRVTAYFFGLISVDSIDLQSILISSSFFFLLSTKNCFKKNHKVFKLLIHFTPVWRRILMPTNYSSYSIFLLPASDYKSSLSQQNIPILGRRGHYKQYLS